MKLNKQEMQNVEGGAITSAMINAVTKVVNTLYELGRSTGSAIIRLIKKTYCPLN